MAISPTSTIKMLQTVVRTGRLMKLSESDMTAQLLGPLPATLTGIPDRNKEVLLTTT